MRSSSPKTLFAVTITAIGMSLLCVGGQDVHGAGCPTQDCESCAFCALATPACVTPCPHGCTPHDQSADAVHPEMSSSDQVETAEVASTGIQLEDIQLTCPIAIDLVDGTGDQNP